MMRRRRPLATGLVAILAVASCRPGADTPQGVAERFLDAHYVAIDLRAAKHYCVGPARQKVEEEARLVGDQVIDAGTRQPQVRYRLAERRDEGAARASFVYEASIVVDDGEPFTRRWLVSTRKEDDGQWKVSNFSEYE
jgi:hypothetical protein